MQHTKAQTKLFGLCLCLLLSIANSQTTTKVTTDFTILNTYTRTGTQYFTEGLDFLNPTTLVESAGVYGSSSINLISFPEMKVIKTTKLGSTYFGEGCQVYNISGVSYIYQMTWKEKKVFVWRAKDLTLYKTLTFPTAVGEGWGMTKGTYVSSGKTVDCFYVSNGSSKIYIVNPLTFAVVKSISVKKRSGTLITQLNELELINGKIWANIFMTSQVAIIDPVTGYVDTIVDFSKLATLAKTKATSMGLTFKSSSVLNGIAYDEINKRIIVTGKRWPVMWQVQVNGI